MEKRKTSSARTASERLSSERHRRPARVAGKSIRGTFAKTVNGRESAIRKLGAHLQVDGDLLDGSLRHLDGRSPRERSQVSERMERRRGRDLADKKHPPLCAATVYGRSPSRVPLARMCASNRARTKRRKIRA